MMQVWPIAQRVAGSTEICPSRISAEKGLREPQLRPFPGIHELYSYSVPRILKHEFIIMLFHLF